MDEMSSRWVRTLGAAAMAGGALWVSVAVMHGLKPRGCVAEECSTRPMRDSGILEGVLMLLALLLIGAGAVGVVALGRRSGRFGRLGMAGISASAAGAALLVTGGLVQAFIFAGDFPLMPLFVGVGLLAFVGGFLMLGIAVLRAGVLPRWVAVLLVAGTASLVVMNEQTALVFMAVPFGVAWVAGGYALLSAPAESGPPRVR